MTANFFLKIPYSFLLLLVSLSSCGNRDHQSNNTVTNQVLDTLYTMKVIGSDNDGWSYQIYKSGKLYINQSIIPAIGGRQKFHSEDDARNVAELVIRKLSDGEGLPTVFIKELDSLKIVYQ